MSFEYHIQIKEKCTELTAYKDGKVFDTKFIYPDEVKDWTTKLLAKKDIKYEDIQAYLKSFKVKGIKIKDNNE